LNKIIQQKKGFIRRNIPVQLTEVENLPTKKQVVEKLGQEMWDKMCKTGWLDGITLTIKRALCNVMCSECGFVKMECLDPYDSYPFLYCPHEDRETKFKVASILKSETDIPESDLNRAYRAAKGEKIHEWEWD